MPSFSRRDALLIMAGLAAAPAVYVGRRWKAKADLKGQQPVEPFRIAGNFYYVGANDESAFLLTGPDGHVVLDGGYPTTAPMIMASIAKLGFDIKDVKVLLNSDARMHAGGLAALQQASGATLWASDASAPVIASGGDDPDMILPLRALVRAGLGPGYPAARVDHRFKDGDTIRLGPLALTAHVTGGASRGCTSWSFAVRDGDRLLNVVSVCGLAVTLGMRYAEQRADLERAFGVLRSLPVDIWVTSHARQWGRYRKFVASSTAKDPVAPFIDPDGYRAYLANAESEFREGRTH